MPFGEKNSFHLAGLAPSTRAGRNRIAFNSSKTPPTAMPTIRKGKRSNQAMGYRINASSASGQHKTNNRHHIKKVNILSFPAIKYARLWSKFQESVGRKKLRF
jgi:hypothetical protein